MMQIKTIKNFIVFLAAIANSWNATLNCANDLFTKKQPTSKNYRKGFEKRLKALRESLRPCAEPAAILAASVLTMACTGAAVNRYRQTGSKDEVSSLTVDPQDTSAALMVHSPDVIHVPAPKVQEVFAREHADAYTDTLDLMLPLTDDDTLARTLGELEASQTSIRTLTAEIDALKSKQESLQASSLLGQERADACERERASNLARIRALSENLESARAAVLKHQQELEQQGTLAAEKADLEQKLQLLEKNSEHRIATMDIELTRLKAELAHTPTDRKIQESIKELERERTVRTWMFRNLEKLKKHSSKSVISQILGDRFSDEKEFDKLADSIKEPAARTAEYIENIVEICIHMLLASVNEIPSQQEFLDALDASAKETATRYLRSANLGDKKDFPAEIIFYNHFAQEINQLYENQPVIRTIPEAGIQQKTQRKWGWIPEFISSVQVKLTPEEEQARKLYEKLSKDHESLIPTPVKATPWYMRLFGSKTTAKPAPQPAAAKPAPKAVPVVAAPAPVAPANQPNSRFKNWAKLTSANLGLCAIGSYSPISALYTTIATGIGSGIAEYKTCGIRNNVRQLAATALALGLTNYIEQGPVVEGAIVAATSTFGGPILNGVGFATGKAWNSNLARRLTRRPAAPAPVVPAPVVPAPVVPAPVVPAPVVPAANGQGHGIRILGREWFAWF